MTDAPRSPSPGARRKSVASKAATPPKTGADELRKYWPVLTLSCGAYVLLQAGNAFVPAITMKAASEDLGMSIASFGALNSVGAGIKSVLIIFCMGPALDKYGPHKMINYCLVGTALCNVGLAFCPGAMSFSAVYLINYVFNSLSEQPAYICLYATYFQELLGVCTTAIASAFSFAGFLIPPLLSPIMVAMGWRSLWIVLAGAIATLLPFAFAVIKPGPKRLNEPEKQHANFMVNAAVLVFASRLYNRTHKGQKRKKLGQQGFAGGRLTSVAATDAELLLHELGKDHAIAGHDATTHNAII